MDHVTQAKIKLRQLFLDELPLKLQQGDLEASDGVTTPPPYEIARTDKETFNGFPAIELVATGSNSITDSSAQVYRHRVVAQFTLTGDDEETLTVQVERYMWAIRQVARNSRVSPPPWGPVDSGSEEYTLVEQRPTGLEVPFVKGGFIELFVETVE